MKASATSAASASQPGAAGAGPRKGNAVEQRVSAATATGAHANVDGRLVASRDLESAQKAGSETNAVPLAASKGMQGAVVSRTWASGTAAHLNVDGGHHSMAGTAPAKVRTTETKKSSAAASRPVTNRPAVSLSPKDGHRPRTDVTSARAESTKGEVAKTAATRSRTESSEPAESPAEVQALARAGHGAAASASPRAIVKVDTPPAASVAAHASAEAGPRPTADAAGRAPSKTDRRPAASTAAHTPGKAATAGPPARRGQWAEPGSHLADNATGFSQGARRLLPAVKQAGHVVEAVSQSNTALAQGLTHVVHPRWARASQRDAPTSLLPRAARQAITGKVWSEREGSAARARLKLPRQHEAPASAVTVPELAASHRVAGHAAAAGTPAAVEPKKLTPQKEEDEKKEVQTAAPPPPSQLPALGHEALGVRAKPKPAAPLPKSAAAAAEAPAQRQREHQAARIPRSQARPRPLLQGPPQ